MTVLDEGHDLRMAMVGAAAWAGGIAAYVAGPRAGWVLAALLSAVVLVAGLRGLRVGQRRLIVAAGLVAATVVAGVLLRHEATNSGPLTGLAEQRTVTELAATVVGDPRPVAGQWGEQVVVRLRVHEARARGERYRLGAAVVVLGGSEWRKVELGERLRVVGRLAPADDPELAALLTGARAPVRIRGPDPWWRAAAAVRASIRASVQDRPGAQRQLVPALVVGDDAGMDPGLEADFRATGLTHLTAVSGTNLTLLLGFVLVIARGAGVRGRWLHLVGVLGVVGFVLLARTEPSVLRAAAMGLVGLFALGTDGRRRGLRALGVAVTGLVLIHPALAVSTGFALSVLATAGIVVIGPGVQRSLARWLPVPLAQAIAVPLAAQVACTPVIAAISGEVSLIAVVANLVVAPVVGPATVLGLAGGLLGLAMPILGRVCGTLAGWCVGWIVFVAGHGADLPRASISWGSGGFAIALLVVLCLGVVIAAPRLLARPWLAGAIGLVLLLVVVDAPGRALPWPTGGWPPPDWVLVACDVGQGDAVVVSLGRGAAIVVDAGPDPELVDDCLDRLRITTLPLVVLTHFHADHIDGLAGVLGGRSVGTIETSAMLDPPEGVADVKAEAERAGAPIGAASYGATRHYDDVTLQVLWPDLPRPVLGVGDGSSANDASVVLLVETHGLRLLLTGDVEPPGQARIATGLPGLDVDVLKVPHHGSRYQDETWLTSLAPEVAVVSVGADNDYGHPSPELMKGLEDAGVGVARTDVDGDLAIVVGDGERPAVVTRE